MIREIDSYVINFCFKRSKFDTCLYCMGNEDTLTYILGLYLDDMLIASQNTEEMRQVKKK